MKYFDQKAVGKRIGEVRKMRDMTQAELAEQLGFSSDRYLQRIESGNRSCPVDKLMEIAQSIDTSTDYLLFGEGRKASPSEEKIIHILSDKSQPQIEYLYRILEVAVESFPILTDSG